MSERRSPFYFLAEAVEARRKHAEALHDEWHRANPNLGCADAAPPDSEEGSSKPPEPPDAE